MPIATALPGSPVWDLQPHVKLPCGHQLLNVLRVPKTEMHQSQNGRQISMCPKSTYLDSILLFHSLKICFNCNSWMKLISPIGCKAIYGRNFISASCRAIELILHASKVMFPILQVRLQQYINWEFPDVQARFRKGKGTRDQIASIHWIIDKAREFQKNIYFCFVDYAKTFVCVDHNKL